MAQTKLPHIGGDLIFAAVLGLLNSLIYPLLQLITHQASIWKILMVALILNFVAYGIIKFVPSWIHISSFQGYFLASVVVALASCFMNYMEKRHSSQHHCKIDEPSHTDRVA